MDDCVDDWVSIYGYLYNTIPFMDDAADNQRDEDSTELMQLRTEWVKGSKWLARFTN